MEQVIRAVQEEQQIRRTIETEFDIAALSGGAGRRTRELWETAMPEVPRGFLDYYFEERVPDNIVFALEGEKVRSMLHMAPYFIAMRRNPPLAGADRLPCMADVVRVPAGMIGAAATDRAYRCRGYMRRLMESALAYQKRRKMPLCFAAAQDEAFLEHFGFHPVFDGPRYELDGRAITQEMLLRAAAGEKVALSPRGTVLVAARGSDLLSLAHFVNARLCVQYGLFVIRSAAYYERFRHEVKSCGGELYLILEDGSLIGYFACMDSGAHDIREAVFRDAADMERYLYADRGQAPSVMARIVDMPEMLRHISGNGKITIAIRLTDPLIAENDGLFRWYIDKDGSHMERVEEAAGESGGTVPAMRPEVTATIGEFTAFLLGYRKLKQNMKFDSIYLSGPAWISERY